MYLKINQMQINNMASLKRKLDPSTNYASNKYQDVCMSQTVDDFEMNCDNIQIIDWDYTPMNKVRRFDSNQTDVTSNSNLQMEVDDTLPNASPPDSDGSSGIKPLDWLLDFRINDLLPNYLPTSSEYNSDILLEGNLNFVSENSDFLNNVQETVEISQVNGGVTNNNGLSELTKQDLNKQTVHQGVAESSQCPPTRYSGPRKPPFTYTELIEHALRERGGLTVSEIYQWISDHFPYYQSHDDRWKNSVRHNLSINPHFRKGKKASQGAGHLWELVNRDTDQSRLTWQHKHKRIQQFIDVTSMVNDETTRATESIIKLLDEPQQQETINQNVHQVKKPRLYTRTTNKNQSKQNSYQEKLKSYQENIQYATSDSNQHSNSNIQISNYENLLNLNDIQQSNVEDYIEYSQNCDNVQIINDITQISDLDHLQIEQNASIEEINLENIENVNIENINFENICIENIKCVDLSNGGVSEDQLMVNGELKLDNEGWVFVEGDLQKTVNEILNGGNNKGNVEVQYIQIVSQKGETDFLNPISKEQIVEECGLIDKSDDFPQGYSLSEVVLGNTNLTTDGLFSDELNLHHLQNHLDASDHYVIPN